MNGFKKGFSYTQQKRKGCKSLSKEVSFMANKSGPQSDIKYCLICKLNLKNVSRQQMKSKGYCRKDGTVAPHTHTYECLACSNRFEINQDR